MAHLSTSDSNTTGVLCLSRRLRESLSFMFLICGILTETEAFTGKGRKRGTVGSNALQSHRITLVEGEEGKQLCIPELGLFFSRIFSSLVLV